jgi:hypothetical protein
LTECPVQYGVRLLDAVAGEAFDQQGCLSGLNRWGRERS